MRGIKVYKRNGAGKRVKDNEPGVWAYAVSWDGKRKRKNCPGRTKSQTEAIARAELLKMQTGEAAQEETQQETNRTIQKLTDQIASLQRQLESKDSNKGERPEIEFTRFRDHVWLPHKKSRNKKTHDEIYVYLAPIYEPFKGMMLHTITTLDVQDWWRKRAETKTRTGGDRSHAALNRELRGLQGLCRVAVEQKYIKRNPCNGVKLFPDDGGRLLIIEVEDEKKIMDAFTGPLEKYKAVFVIAINTGMRLFELTENFLWENINWSDDPEKRAVTVYGKGGKWRTIPLNDTACGALKELGAESKGRGRVFDGPGFSRMSISNKIAEVCDAVGLPEITLHSCRHSFITRLLENGASLEHVRVLAGHAKISTTIKYAHLAQSRTLHKAVQTLVPFAPPKAKIDPLETGKRQYDGTIAE